MREGKVSFPFVASHLHLLLLLSLSCFFFSRDIFDAMFMVKHEADEVIIQQGTVCIYIVHPLYIHVHVLVQTSVCVCVLYIVSDSSCVYMQEMKATTSM